MIEAFENYVSMYDKHNKKIKMKYDHSFRVMDLSHEYAIKLGMDAEDVYLATLIGLLHDIGRFEQLKVFDTFDDRKSIDHADYSVEQLFEKQGIGNFIQERKFDDIIRLAIQNHNKFMITGISDDRTMMHCKLIRDTDKLDILYNVAYLGEIELKESNDAISMEVIDDMKNHLTIERSHSHNPNDRICSFMAFAFDINYDICLDKVKEYIKVIYRKLQHKELFNDMYREVMMYIEKRMK